METPPRRNLALAMTILGALVGGLLSSWLAPKMIVWYFTPPAQMGLNCSDPITWALGKMQLALALGIVCGGIVGIVLYFFFARRFAASRTP